MWIFGYRNLFVNIFLTGGIIFWQDFWLQEFLLVWRLDSKNFVESETFNSTRNGPRLDSTREMPDSTRDPTRKKVKLLDSKPDSKWRHFESSRVESSRVESSRVDSLTRNSSASLQKSDYFAQHWQIKGATAKCQIIWSVYFPPALYINKLSSKKKGI